MAKKAPDSRTPRRFVAASVSTSAHATSGSCPDRPGIAEAAFWTPEDTDTATVST
jgi:hypothetical protein